MNNDANWAQGVQRVSLVLLLCIGALTTTTLAVAPCECEEVPQCVLGDCCYTFNQCGPEGFICSTEHDPETGTMCVWREEPQCAPNPCN